MTSASEPVKLNWPREGSVYHTSHPSVLSSLPLIRQEKLTASHFIEFSGVRLPNSRIVTAESCALLKRFESEHVPQNFFPFALNALSRPVAAGAGDPVDVGEEGVVVVPLPVPGWHW